jgi:hypothetical protein
MLIEERTSSIPRRNIMSHAIDTIQSLTSDSADRAVGLAKHTALGARVGLRGIADGVLDRLGLARKQGPLGTIMLLGIGLLVGGVAVAFLTPTSGPALRLRIRRFFDRKAEALMMKEAQLEHAIEQRTDFTHPTDGKAARAARTDGMFR